MDKRDNLGKEIKDIMEEESFNLTLSQNALDKIHKSRKRTLREKLKGLLNREIEIPLRPIVIGLAAAILITFIPGESYKSYEERVIDIGGSQVIIREGYEVSKNEDKD